MSFLSRLFATSAPPLAPRFLPGETVWQVGDSAQCDFAGEYWPMLSGALATGPRAGQRDIVLQVDRIPPELLARNAWLGSTQLLVFARFPDKRFLASQFTRIEHAEDPARARSEAKILRLDTYRHRKTCFPTPQTEGNET